MIRVTRALVCAALLAIGCASSASAQIINTLRGFNDEDRGWSGSVEGVAAIADGNSDYFEFEIAGALQYQGERQRWRLMGRNQRRTASGIEIAESRRAHLRHNYRILPWLASVAFLQGQYEPFKRIENRLLAGGGARFDLIEGVRWHTAVGATVMLENEELTDAPNSTTTHGRFSFFVSVFRDVAEGVDVDLVGFYQPRIDRPGDARADVTASVRIDIVGQLYTVLRYSAEYDSDPPPGVDDLDQNFRAGLGFDL